LIFIDLEAIQKDLLTFQRQQEEEKQHNEK
jgi:hypothetical protein